MEMSVKEFYELVNGDYDSALSRIMKESSMVRFLKMFADDTQYSRMMEGLENKDYKQVFASSHDIKGTCANLGLTQLASSSSDICEAVRNGEPTVDLQPLVEKVRADYTKTIEYINQL